MLLRKHTVGLWGRSLTASVLGLGCLSSQTHAGTPLKTGPDACGASRVQRFVGKLATPEVKQQVAATSGAKAIRWLTPDMMATMDYSEERLNVMLRADKTIDAAKCG